MSSDSSVVLPNVKVVFVGEPKSGKSTVIAVSQIGHIPEYIPNVSGHSCIDEGTIHLDSHTLQIWDTVAHPDWDRLRPLCYPQTDLFIFCMDISDIQSFESNVIQNKRITECYHYI